VSFRVSCCGGCVSNHDEAGAAEAAFGDAHSGDSSAGIWDEGGEKACGGRGLSPRLWLGEDGGVGLLATRWWL
jgi:hypothetical protein